MCGQKWRVSFFLWKSLYILPQTSLPPGMSPVALASSLPVSICRMRFKLRLIHRMGRRHWKNLVSPNSVEIEHRQLALDSNIIKHRPISCLQDSEDIPVWMKVNSRQTLHFLTVSSLLPACVSVCIRRLGLGEFVYCTFFFFPILMISSIICLMKEMSVSGPDFTLPRSVAAGEIGLYSWWAKTPAAVGMKHPGIHWPLLSQICRIFLPPKGWGGRNWAEGGRAWFSLICGVFFLPNKARNGQLTITWDTNFCVLLSHIASGCLRLNDRPIASVFPWNCSWVMNPLLCAKIYLTL